MRSILSNQSLTKQPINFEQRLRFKGLSTSFLLILFEVAKRTFLMNKPLTAINKPRIGTCPHGLPQGACPICNGMGGGGGASTKKANSQKEMSWSECYAAWQQMDRAKQASRQRQEITHNPPLSFSSKLGDFSQKLANLSEKLATFAKNPTNMPRIISAPLALIARVAIPILNTIKTLSNITQNTINFVKEKFINITDKLNAIFGELKASIEKKISDNLKDFKKKFKSIFGIYEPEDIIDEDRQIEEQKRIFELKTVLNSIKEKYSQNNES